MDTSSRARGRTTTTVQKSATSKRSAGRRSPMIGPTTQDETLVGAQLIGVERPAVETAVQFDTAEARRREQFEFLGRHQVAKDHLEHRPLHDALVLQLIDEIVTHGEAFVRAAQAIGQVAQTNAS